jgi:hypothetical protein
LDCQFEWDEDPQVPATLGFSNFSRYQVTRVLTAREKNPIIFISVEDPARSMVETCKMWKPSFGEASSTGALNISWILSSADLEQMRS